MNVEILSPVVLMVSFEDECINALRVALDVKNQQIEISLIILKKKKIAIVIEKQSFEIVKE